MPTATTLSASDQCAVTGAIGDMRRARGDDPRATLAGSPRHSTREQVCSARSGGGSYSSQPAASGSKVAWSDCQFLPPKRIASQLPLDLGPLAILQGVEQIAEQLFTPGVVHGVSFPACAAFQNSFSF